MEEDYTNIPFYCDKYFDLYNHLKCNIKCTVGLCEIHDSLYTTYCFQCKRAICEVCRDSFHTTHAFIDKIRVGMEKEHINSIFDNLESLIKSTDSFYCPEKINKELKSKVNKEFDIIFSKLEELKKRRLREIDNIFGNTGEEAKKLLNIISVNKKKLLTFCKKNQEFLYGPNIPDDDSFIFLHLYDIFNESVAISNEYIEVISNIKEYYEDVDLRQENKYEFILKDIEKALKDQKKSEVMNANLLVLESNDMDPDSNHRLSKREEMKQLIVSKIDKLTENLYSPIITKAERIEDLIESFKKKVFDSFKKHGSLVEIEKIVKMYEEKTTKRMNYIQKAGMRFNNSNCKSGVKSGTLNRSKATLQSAKKDKSDANNSFNNETKEKEEKKTENKPIKLQKNKLQQLFSLAEKEEDEDNENYSNRKSKGSVEEEEFCLNNSFKDDFIDVKISRNIRDNEKVFKKLHTMFRPKPKTPKSKNNSFNIVLKKDIKENEEEKFKVNSKLMELIQENKRLTNMIKSKEDISLIITTIRRYFSFSALDYHQANTIRMKGVESNQFLSTNTNDLTDEIVKIYEGTEDITIYDRKKGKIIKKTIEFNKKKDGCSHFLIGSRNVFYQDKVFITGGKDIQGDKKLFLVYSVKESKLSRLPDMANARSYHTMIYHENLKCLVVVGGENNSTCEMYDFYLNMWNSMPELNVPRANLSVYIDKVGTFAYTVCGILGSITQGNYSDAIEYLDLVDMGPGWVRIDYNNKANVDLKKNENKLFPLTEDKLLIYGGSESRNDNKCFVLLDLKTFDLIKLDKKILEEIKIKAFLHPDLTNI